MHRLFKFYFQIFAVSLCAAAKLQSKEKEDAATSSKQEADSKTVQTAAATASAPAIIAIEIVDPNENKTGNKNSKRTIESNLGYGYEGNKPAKFEVYKYSQHDIPPYKGAAATKDPYSKNANLDYDIQKSIDYSVNPHQDENQHYNHGQSGYTQSPTPSASPLNQYYQPGTMLYTTLNNQGHLGDLSANAPYQGNPGNVPVIVLRIHPEQLAGLGGGLYANLPQTHPFANNINGVDIQSLLANYVQNLLQGQQKQNVYQAPDYHGYHGDYGYSNPGYQAPSQYYQPNYQPNYQQQYQYPYQYQQPQTFPGVSSPQLQTFENFPGDAHTKVIFKDADKSSKSAAPSVSSSPAYKGFSEESKAPEEQNKYGHESQEHDDGYYYDKPGQIGSHDYYSHDNYDKLDDKPNSQDYYSHDSYEKPGSQNYFPEDHENYKTYSSNNGNEASYEVSQFHPTTYNTGNNNYDGQYGELPPVASDKSPDEPFNYHAHSTANMNNERSKKSSNIRMRIPKSLKKSQETARDKREKTEETETDGEE